MKITLQVNGWEMTFSEDELTVILEKYFRTEATPSKIMVPKPPIEGEWFQVNPQLINQELFQKKREDESQ